MLNKVALLSTFFSERVLRENFVKDKIAWSVDSLLGKEGANAVIKTLSMNLAVHGVKKKILINPTDT